jgi:lysine 2,3-aminomutase
VEWNDWRWQIANRFRDAAALSRVLQLSPVELAGLADLSGHLPLSVTPYYASLLNGMDEADPLRRTIIPSADELILSPGESIDPLGEEDSSPVPGLVHRYPDRVLFLVTDFCSTYCRYCTRSRLVGHGAEHGPSRKRWSKALAYIAGNRDVRDVILSGGDPLTLPDEELRWLLASLRRIPHVEVVRIGTKVPAVLPQRITKSLARMLKEFHPLFASLHFAHPRELTEETAQACGRLADAGLPLGSQTVLLRGVNDRVETMRDLCQGLMRMRVRPYYLYQCDPIKGSAHFRTTVETGLGIIKGLRGFTSGYAVPTYVIDAPGGGGKIPLQPNYVVGRDGDDLLLRNFRGEVYRYPDPV